MARNRKNVAYIKLPCSADSKKAKVVKVGKMAVICTQKSEKIEELDVLPKTLTKHEGENF